MAFVADEAYDMIYYIINGATAGYRYFSFTTAKTITVETRGNASWTFVVRDDRQGSVVARIPMAPSIEWAAFSAPLHIEDGKKPLYFTYEDAGAADSSGSVLNPDLFPSNCILQQTSHVVFVYSNCNGKVF